MGLSLPFANRCPACGKGTVFRGLLSMAPQCSECGLRYEKEPGFFLGASIVAYFIGAFSIVPTLIICLLLVKLDIFTTLAIGTAQLLLLTPLLFRYSRLLWLHTEHRMTTRMNRR